jgi:hypothetical protein
MEMITEDDQAKAPVGCLGTMPDNARTLHPAGRARPPVEIVSETMAARDSYGENE